MSGKLLVCSITGETIDSREAIEAGWVVGRHPADLYGRNGWMVILSPDVAHLGRLVDSAELARLLGGIFEQTVNRWQDRYQDFPPPVQWAGRSKLWWLPDVLEWLDKHRPELVDQVILTAGPDARGGSPVRRQNRGLEPHPRQRRTSRLSPPP